MGFYKEDWFNLIKLKYNNWILGRIKWLTLYKLLALNKLHIGLAKKFV